MRGFASVGLVRPKDLNNVGSVLRAAHCYNVSMVAIEGARTPIKHSTDTPKAWRHTPVIRTDELRGIVPYACVPVAVDLVDGATSLIDFQHPQSAFYIFGPEDGTLTSKTLDWCPHKIMIPTLSCMNLAATVNVVLYDRMLKNECRNQGLTWGKAA